MREHVPLINQQIHTRFLHERDQRKGGKQERDHHNDEHRSAPGVVRRLPLLGVPLERDGAATSAGPAIAKKRHQNKGSASPGVGSVTTLSFVSLLYANFRRRRCGVIGCPCGSIFSIVSVVQRLVSAS